jgi:polysaccharide export outer membrane protein
MRGIMVVGIALGAARAMAQLPTVGDGLIPVATMPREAPRDASQERPREVFPPSVPTGALEGAIDPARYMMGPGDRLLVELWGMHDVTADVEVNAEGRLLVPRAGVFDVRGLSLADVRTAVEKRLHEVYPSLHGGVTLVRPRSFLVHVTGAVTRPGTYPATPSTRVSALVQDAGGPLPRASTRAVQVRRPGNEARITADLVRFTLLGDRGGDPTVLDGDTIFVPLREVEVEVTGAVRRPGRYELVEGRDVAELLALAGGVTAEASMALPLRVTERPSGDRVVVRSVTLAEARALPLRDGDRLHVPLLADLRRTVVVEGAIVGVDGAAAQQRAPYLVDHHVDAPMSQPREVSIPVAYVEGDGVRDLITKVGGLQPWAEAGSAFLLRTVDGTRRRIAVDVPEIAAGRAPDLEVRPGDTLVVPSRQESVLVGGAVARPGLYAYRRELAGRDYLILAGGTTRTADVGGARVLHRDGRSTLLSKSTVEPGDAISVPERRITAAEWVEITLLAGNAALGATTLALSARK